jgi:hypothetical protein
MDCANFREDEAITFKSNPIPTGDRPEIVKQKQISGRWLIGGASRLSSTEGAIYVTSGKHPAAQYQYH